MKTHHLHQRTTVVGAESYFASVFTFGDKTTWSTTRVLERVVGIDALSRRWRGREPFAVPAASAAVSEACRSSACAMLWLPWTLLSREEAVSWPSGPLRFATALRKAPPRPRADPSRLAIVAAINASP